MLKLSDSIKAKQPLESSIPGHISESPLSQINATIVSEFAMRYSLQKDQILAIFDRIQAREDYFFDQKAMIWKWVLDVFRR